MTYKKKTEPEIPEPFMEEEALPEMEAEPELEAPPAEEALPGKENEPEREVPQEELSGKIKEALAKRDEYLNLAQRVQADFENFKRRNQSIRADAFEEGKRDVIIEMLPVLDNMERALAAEGEETPLKSGVEMVYRQMLDVLGKFGVTEIDCHGKPFDPENANAVMQVQREDMEPGAVCGVMQKGYRMGDKVLRYAMVQVVGES